MSAYQEFVYYYGVEIEKIDRPRVYERFIDWLVKNRPKSPKPGSRTFYAHITQELNGCRLCDVRKNHGYYYFKLTEEALATRQQLIEESDFPTYESENNYDLEYNMA